MVVALTARLGNAPPVLTAVFAPLFSLPPAGVVLRGVGRGGLNGTVGVEHHPLQPGGRFGGVGERDGAPRAEKRGQSSISPFRHAGLSRAE